MWEPMMNARQAGHSDGNTPERRRIGFSSISLDAIEYNFAPENHPVRIVETFIGEKATSSQFQCAKNFCTRLFLVKMITYQDVLNFIALGHSSFVSNVDPP